MLNLTPITVFPLVSLFNWETLNRDINQSTIFAVNKDKYNFNLTGHNVIIKIKTTYFIDPLWQIVVG